MPQVRATIRLQFHSSFTFRDAIPLVKYFSELGISHIYSSPILKARAGSTHGYDVVDPTQVNPELGGEQVGMALEADARHDAVEQEADDAEQDDAARDQQFAARQSNTIRLMPRGH